ncbi:hypothetical protein FQA39_LY13763 [Lamprigera yunnana]|nr:hypothetical protein FQA39_LY13763 [Lamprigera yunnana]
MKIVFVLLCALACVSHQLNMTTMIEDFEDVIDKNAKECYSIFHLNREQLDEMVKHEALPNDNNLKCYLLCIFVHLDIFDESGTLLTENLKKYMEFDIEQRDIVFNACRVLQGSNGCEKAFNMIICVRNKLASLYSVVQYS